MDAADQETDLKYLKEKVDCGADFILTQLFFDVDTFVDFVKRCRANGITVPIIPGIMPIPTNQSFRRIINLCRIQVPKPILADLDAIRVRRTTYYCFTAAVCVCSYLILDR